MPVYSYITLDDTLADVLETWTSDLKSTGQVVGWYNSSTGAFRSLR
jgi:hypothetical protein